MISYNMGRSDKILTFKSIVMYIPVTIDSLFILIE